MTLTPTLDKLYAADLNELERYAATLPNTRMMAIAKIEVLLQLNMRYERIMLNRNLDTHPYELVRQLLQDARRSLAAWADTRFIEADTPPLQRLPMQLEESHEKLFQQLWVKFSSPDYEQRIERYLHRLRINKLGRPWMEGKRCIDFGCGHGNFAHALLREGARSVVGIDFGRASIDYALRARDALGVSPEQIDFVLGSVYQVPFADDSFDFAIQNGVFHHLDDEDRAISEMHRVLAPGGWMWYYTDGSGGISYDLWDASVRILAQVPQELIISHLEYLNIETGKRYHLGDGLNAVYRHTSWQELTTRLSRLGFGEFKRLVGGFPTDFDHDIIALDKYGREKFGEGDLRLLARKIG
jgi:2-polyprenyl-6-hydroxyphenyl methylase/3-demethylubiquinone-9 3-methyltransferase